MRYIFKNRFYIFLISVIDFLGWIIFLPFRFLKNKIPGNVGNILVIRLDHIGDVICSTPVAQSLKEHYRGAKITYLVASWAKEIVMNNPYVDEIICYDAPWFSQKRKRIFDFIETDDFFIKKAIFTYIHKKDNFIDITHYFKMYQDSKGKEPFTERELIDFNISLTTWDTFFELFLKQYYGIIFEYE